MDGSVAHLAVAAGCTAFALLAGAVSLSGAAAGLLLAFAFLELGSWPAFLGLLLLVAGGTLASRLGRSRKLAAGVAQSHGGRRGAVHALANAGPALLFLYLAHLGVSPVVAAWGALVAAFSDTVSSELGLLSRSEPRLLLVLRPVPRGTDGGMTPFGTLWGLAAALLGGLCSAAALGIGAAAGAVFAGGVAGNLVDSLLGAGVEPHLPRPCGNEVVNAVATAIGGVVAWYVFTVLGKAA